METTPIPTRHVGSIRAHSCVEVEDFLARAESEREALSNALAEAHARLAALQQRVDASTYRRDHLGNLVVEAQRTAMSRRAGVEAALAEIVNAAESQADALLTRARIEAAALRSGGARSRSAGINGANSTVDLTSIADEVS
jgi:cell division septum initiation protein DivIVA